MYLMIYDVILNMIQKNQKPIHNMIHVLTTMSCGSSKYTFFIETNPLKVFKLLSNPTKILEEQRL